MGKSSRRDFIKGLFVGGGLTALGAGVGNYFKQEKGNTTIHLEQDEEYPLYHFFHAYILSEEAILKNKDANKFSRDYIINDNERIKRIEQSRALEVYTEYKSWVNPVPSPDELFEVNIWEGKYKMGRRIKQRLPDRPETYTFVLNYANGKTEFSREEVSFLNNHEILNAFFKGLQIKSSEELYSSYDWFSLRSKDLRILMNTPSGWEGKTDLPYHLVIRPKNHLVSYVIEGLDALTFGNKELINNMWKDRKNTDFFEKYKSDLNNIEKICLRNI